MRPGWITADSTSRLLAQRTKYEDHVRPTKKAPHPPDILVPDAMPKWLKLVFSLSLAQTNPEGFLAPFSAFRLHHYFSIFPSRSLASTQYCRSSMGLPKFCTRTAAVSDVHNSHYSYCTTQQHPRVGTLDSLPGPQLLRMRWDPSFYADSLYANFSSTLDTRRQAETKQERHPSLHDNIP